MGDERLAAARAALAKAEAAVAAKRAAATRAKDTADAAASAAVQAQSAAAEAKERVRLMRERHRALALSMGASPSAAAAPLGSPPSVAAPSAPEEPMVDEAALVQAIAEAEASLAAEAKARSARDSAAAAPAPTPPGFGLPARRASRGSGWQVGGAPSSSEEVVVGGAAVGFDSDVSKRLSAQGISFGGIKRFNKSSEAISSPAASAPQKRSSGGWTKQMSIDWAEVRGDLTKTRSVKDIVANLDNKIS